MLIISHATIVASSLLIVCQIALFAYGDSGHYFSGIYLASLFYLAWDSIGQVLERLYGAMSQPRECPRLDYVASGVPNDCVVAIATPTILIDLENLERTLLNLEMNYVIANDTNVIAVLLTDYSDSSVKHATIEEEELFSMCAQSINALNKKYESYSHCSFVLLHRDRDYSATQRSWIGNERKRGKLQALNSYITNHGNEFTFSSENANSLHRVKYVLSLDDDTKLTANAVQLLVGNIAHPSNLIELNRLGTNVLAGNAMVVPKLVASHEASKPWKKWPQIIGPFMRPGSKATAGRSFLYDYFGQTAFPGKALYDVHIAHKVLHGALPNELVLSHDTLEGTYLRPAFAGDVTLEEGLPSSYRNISVRQHRWVRGDWQNIAVLFLGLFRDFKLNLPAISYHIIINQIRISLLPPALVLALVAALYSNEPNIQVGVILFTLFVPAATHIFT